MAAEKLFKLVPHEVILVSSIPACNFCQDGTPGPYDFKTYMGPWANGCEKHWKQMRASGQLGTGHGQLWVTDDQVERNALQQAKHDAKKARGQA